MSTLSPIPRILVIDDQFGRILRDRRNQDRANLCGRWRLEDVTGDEKDKGKPQQIRNPMVRAVFCRGQVPACANVGDEVRNELEKTLDVVRAGWNDCPPQNRWALVLLDLCFLTGRVTLESDGDLKGMPAGHDADRDPARYFGMELLTAIRSEFPDLPVIILSSMSKDEVSERYHKLKADAFLARADNDAAALFETYLFTHGLIPDETGHILGFSIQLLKTLREARYFARGRTNVMIYGENGTGKEMLARYLLRWSPCAQKHAPVTIDCGGLNPNLFGSELFGHVKGAFTGAHSARIGAIEAAHGSDLFLDEIANMDTAIQAGVLRSIQERQISRVGSTGAIDVDVRFVSATNEDLQEKVAAGRFREDLLHRLKVGYLELPALRERLDDLPLLVEGLVRRAEATSRAVRRRIQPDTIDLLCAYDWPGNIRELANCIESAVIRHPHYEFLFPDHLLLPQRALRGEMVGRNTTDNTLSAEFNLDALIKSLEDFQFDHAKQSDLAARWPMLRAAFGLLAARFLNCALELTGKPVPGPDGTITWTPIPQTACGLITGQEVKGTGPADLINKICSLDPDAVRPLLEGDNPLAEAVRAKSKRWLVTPRVRNARRLLVCIERLPNESRQSIESADPVFAERQRKDAAALLATDRFSDSDAVELLDHFRKLPDDLLETLITQQPDLAKVRKVKLPRGKKTTQQE